MKKYYFALFDNQLNSIVATGFNSRTKKSVREDLINYLLLGNFSEEGEDSIKQNTLEELLNYYEFTLLISEKKFEENKQ
ncbi:MAG: hypothetical protein WCS27_07515 [Victivallaceae bacterium]|jgi:hypothetical protein